jgi:hypothetical protein
MKLAVKDIDTFAVKYGFRLSVVLYDPFAFIFVFFQDSTNSAEFKSS